MGPRTDDSLEQLNFSDDVEVKDNGLLLAPRTLETRGVDSGLPDLGRRMKVRQVMAAKDGLVEQVLR